MSDGACDFFLIFLHEIKAIEGSSRKFRNSVLMASWNVRSLVENAGDVYTYT